MARVEAARSPRNDATRLTRMTALILAVTVCIDQMTHDVG